MVAEPVQEITDEIVELAQEMIEIVLREPGLGLAAPQVGESLRLVVVRFDAEDEEKEKPRIIPLLNPKVAERSEETVQGREGCLSLPTLYGDVERASEVLVKAVSLDGEEVEIEASGLGARVLQHEVDHLDGVLFIDRVVEDTLVWLIPDEDEESGYREKPTTIDEVVERFEKLRQRQQSRA